MRSTSPEGDLKTNVLAYLEMAGHRFFRMQSGRVQVRRGWLHLHPEGTADFLICLAHCPNAWVELKAEGYKTSKERTTKQAEFAEDVKALGHRYRICWSVAEVASFLGDVAAGRA